MYRAIGSSEEKPVIGRLTWSIAAFVAVLMPLGANAEPLKSCTNASWVGNYGFKLTGERIGGTNPGPRAGVGIISSDGQGNLTGMETKSANGVIFQAISFTGTYNMLNNCTGTGAVTFTDGETRNFNFVVVERAEEVVAIQTDPGRVITITATKQSAK